MSSVDLAARLLRLSWRKRIRLLDSLGVLPPDWREGTDEEVLRAGIRGFVDTGANLEVLEAALDLAEDVTLDSAPEP